MGLIIGSAIKKMIPGYPTVSDKYNVAGGIWESSTAGKFGQLVQKGTTRGYYKSAAGASAVDAICGIILATNVKTPSYPSMEVEVYQGEAFNLFCNGFIAIELDSAATAAQITPNAKVCVILSTGKATTADKYNASTAPYLPNMVFTGEYENQGTAASPKLVAEVYVK